MQSPEAAARALLAAQIARDPWDEHAALMAYRPNRWPNRRAESLLSAFFARLKFGATECWHWVGCLSDIGYGTFAQARRYGCPEIMAHRIAWALFHGQVPDGMNVLHRCDVRSCVNPGHLFLGTQADNVRDMVAKGRNRTGRLTGAKNPMARLSPDAVAAIRAAHAAGGETQRAIARRFGVSPMTISRAVRRESWREQ